ncbi:hypothetical protein LCGC14_2232620 [marine sediment metagenome]|uniref:Uncharacterized protein n=1 Tax=marine sediment metagenome TaxID=412755 RepID=A0A0F9D7Z1_9ZZZZ
MRGKRGDLVISKDGYYGIILAVERNKTIVFMGNSLRMVCEPDDLKILPIKEVGGAGDPGNNPSNFYELLPVHYDDAPHDFRIKQVEQDQEIELCFEELEKTRLAFRLLVDELAESKKIGDEVLARLREGTAAREKQT